MSTPASVEKALIARDWFSIPVISAHHMIIEFHFDFDHTGWSRYAIWGNDQTLPNIIEATWSYVVQDKHLLLTWDDGTFSTIDYELIFEEKLAYARGSEQKYDAILRVSEHLFPISSGFPQGWLKDYWGRPHKEDQIERGDTNA